MIKAEVETDDMIPAVSSNGNFLWKLSQILDDEDAEPFISWTDDGDSIEIHDPRGFEDKILPRFFKHRNFASFVRQLNLYGFRKSSLESSRFEFMHPTFRKGSEHISQTVPRRMYNKDDLQCAAKDAMRSLMELVERQEKCSRALNSITMSPEKELLSQSKARQDSLERTLNIFSDRLEQTCKVVANHTAEQISFEDQTPSLRQNTHDGYHAICTHVLDTCYAGQTPTGHHMTYVHRSEPFKEAARSHLSWSLRKDSKDLDSRAEDELVSWQRATKRRY